MEVVPDAKAFSSIISSPQEYHYRNRIDLKLKRFRSGDIEIGFTPSNRYGVLPIESCAIARREISDEIPQIKKEALEKLPEKYKIANLTVRSGDEKRVFWGGIGKGSLRLEQENYFWTDPCSQLHRYPPMCQSTFRPNRKVRLQIS